MQDRTIDNALRAILRGGGEQGELAKRLLVMRGARLPDRIQIRPMKRGTAASFVLTAIRAGDTTVCEMVDRLQAERPDVSRKSAHNRCNGALLRLEAKGLVVREGRAWRLAQ